MRYIPNTPDDCEAMLRDIGVSSFEDLLKPVPKAIRLQRPLNLPAGKPEQEVMAIMNGMAHKNRDAASMISFLGAGSYDHYIPAAISAVMGRSEYLTAYTPYQPEVSQGTLQVIYEFQSMICELFGMPAANASLYDGGTALAEAIMLATGHTRRSKVIWFDSVHPHYCKVVQTVADPQGTQFVSSSTKHGFIDPNALTSELKGDVAAVVFQYPNFFGLIEDIRPLIDKTHEAGALAIVVADPLAMGVLEAPGKLGADIVVGEGQGLGNGQSYGGPYLGLFAASDKLVRRMPGRIVGVTKDADGQRGYVLTLQTREQHIRRDKATSNICTNEGLCAARAAMYLSLLGPNGLRQIGETCMNACSHLRNRLTKISGIELPFTGTHFKEFVLQIPGNTDDFLRFMTDRGILAGIPLKRFNMKMDNAVLVAVTEQRTLEQLDAYAEGVRAFVEGGAK